MYSHEQLINAVRAAGRDGKTFSVKDVREQLGFETRDKRELSRFRRRLRTFEKDAAQQLEKVGNNSYRLKPGAFEEEPASGVFHTVEPAAQVEHTPAEPSPAEASVEPPPLTASQAPQLVAAASLRETGAAGQPTYSRQTPVQRVRDIASAIVSGALAASAAVSSKARERGRTLREQLNLREQLAGCLHALPLKQHAVARLQGWAEGLRPLPRQVLDQLQALRQRVSLSRRRAA